jgi:hypothetical protein
LLIHTLYDSIQRVLRLLRLLYLHCLSPGNGFQYRSFLSFCIHVLTGQQLSHNSLIAPSLVAISHQPPTLLTAVSRLLMAAGPRYIVWHRPHREHYFQQLFYCCMCVCCGYYLAKGVVYRAINYQRSLFTEPLLSNGCCIAAYFAVVA